MAATTSLLGLVTPTQGDLSGTWGNTVNNGITEYVDISVAGTLTLTNDGAVTLANTLGSASASSIVSTLTGAGTVTAQFAIVRVTGTLTTAKVVTGPSYSKTYTVVNAATGGIVTFKASGQTGVSVAVGESAFVYFNGTDYVKIVGTATAGAAGGSTTQVQFNSSGVLAGSANLTWNGTSLSATQIDITAQGTLRLQDTTGGEYVALRAPASLAGNYTLTFPADDGTSGQALITDGSGVLSWSTAASGDVYGPASATANGIALFDGTTGKLLKDSAATDGLIYGLTVGRGLAGVATNTAVGASALAANTTGQYNTAVGNLALQANTSAGSNTAVGYAALLVNTTGAQNTALGIQALNANTTGTQSIAVGGGALYLNTTGSSNVAIGYNALLSNTVASYNTAVGYQAGYSYTTSSFITAIGYRAGYSSNAGGMTAVGANVLYNNTGTGNVGIGGEYFTVSNAALYANTSGTSNTAIGVGALTANTTASENTAVGYQALYSNTVNGCTAVGFKAGYANTTGDRNTALGWTTLDANTTGNYNTALGAEALGTNTTGSSNTAVGLQALITNSTGSNNVSVGFQSLALNTTASNNTAAGYQALSNNTTGSTNVAVGGSSLLGNTTGTDNCAVGAGAGINNVTGNGNTFVGREAGYYATGSGNVVMGSSNGSTYAPVFDVTSASNRVVMGSTSVTNAYIQVAWTVVSDLRDKVILGDVPLGLDFVRKLKPIKYQFKENRESNTPHGAVKYGFGAQDVLAEEGNSPVIVDTEMAEKLKITDSHMMPVFANAIKEMADMIDQLKAEIAALKGA